MKTLISKYPGQCKSCSKSFPKGELIAWSKAHGAKHLKCAGIYAPESPHEVRAACWECGDPEGKFRPYGAATPVRCDSCEAKFQAVKKPEYQSNYARFSSGAEWYQNKRGRCEDAPCCGCCS
jgi:hypothetical protein